MLDDAQIKLLLETAPLQTKVETDLIYTSDGRLISLLEIPGAIRVWCKECGHEITFSLVSEYARQHLSIEKDGQQIFLAYRCVQCDNSIKTFVLLVMGIEVLFRTCSLTKVGEWPPAGKPLPERLVRLVGTDKDFLLKGYKAERLGFGLGSFIYYRRIVENHKTELLQEILNTAKSLDCSQSSLDILHKAIGQRQFAQAMTDAAKVIPQELLIDGKNPLTLLHKAISIGVHGLTDSACLEYATAVREVLLFLLDRMSVIRSDKQALRSAVATLEKATAKSVGNKNP